MTCVAEAGKNDADFFRASAPHGITDAAFDGLVQELDVAVSYFVQELLLMFEVQVRR